MDRLSVAERETLEQFEQARGAFLNHFVMIEGYVEDMIVESIVGSPPRAEATELLRRRFVDRIPFKTKEDALRDVIKFSGREADYGDLPDDVNRATKHRNLLAHNMGPAVTTTRKVVLQKRRGLGSETTEFTPSDLFAKADEAEALRNRVRRLYLELFHPEALVPATNPLHPTHPLSRGAAEGG
jgi:hypothetical protein